MAKVLVACEESQAVACAFRALGIEAWSCDTEPCSGGHPEWHLQEDVMGVLDRGWSLMIAHPPCTYLSNAGAKHLFKGGVLNQDRYKLGLEAKKFFMALLDSGIPHVCVENPVPSTVYELPKYSQIIQPYQFGHPYQKRTCLWLKCLPPLVTTHWVAVTESTRVAGNWFNTGGRDRQKNRSKTFPGIAQAMASQWSSFVQ
jgi:hypothetical protein